MATSTDLLDAMRTSLREHREAIEAKLDQARRESSESTRRIYDRIDEHAAETRNAIAKLSTDLTVVSTRFDSHDMQDERRFTAIDQQLDEIEEAIEDSRKDRGRLWRRLGVAGLLGGGSGIGILEALRHLFGSSGGHG